MVIKGGRKDKMGIKGGRKDKKVKNPCHKLKQIKYYVSVHVHFAQHMLRSSSEISQFSHPIIRNNSIDTCTKNWSSHKFPTKMFLIA